MLLEILRVNENPSGINGIQDGHLAAILDFGSPPKIQTYQRSVSPSFWYTKLMHWPSRFGGEDLRKLLTDGRTDGRTDRFGRAQLL